MFDELLNASRLALSSVDFTNANRPAFLSDELTESLGDDVFLSLQENRSGNRFAVLASGANGDQATHEGQAEVEGSGTAAASWVNAFAGLHLPPDPPPSKVGS